MVQFLAGAFILALGYGLLRLFVGAEPAALLKAGLGLLGVLCLVACAVLIASERFAWAALPFAALGIGLFIRYFKKDPQ